MTPEASTRAGRRLPLAVVVAPAGFIAAVLATATAQAPPRFNLAEVTVAELQHRMEAGQETSRSIVEKYLSRIDAIDRNGPQLRSILELNPDARSIADAMDAERRSGRVRGPLHGVPVLLKDNIATADHMMTTAGSLAMAGPPAPRDAFVVEQLRKAGAVILGKTNMSEWANFRSTHSSSGWSARGGQTKNPYALDRNPSGSSSGSGVAVAANLAAVAVGSETDGSIVSPSHLNGLVGIKPTLGLVSQSGIIPIAHSQDTAGPMARSVEDAAVLLGVLAGGQTGVRPRSDPGLTPDYRPALVRDGLRGARIGVVRTRLFGYHAAADALAERAISDMKSAGAVIVDPANIETIARLDANELEVLLYEFKADLNAYLTSLNRPSVRSLMDLIAFNEAHKNEELAFFGQELMLMAQQKGPLSESKYRTTVALNRRLAGTLGIDATMNKLKLDALVAPTGGPAWITDLVNGDGGTASSPGPSTVTSIAGYPHITVPMGSVRGLPVGISFFGRAWSEPTLIRLAYAYEQATKHRRQPTFAVTASTSP